MADEGKKIRVRTLRRTEFVEVGKDRFDYYTSEFLNKVGKDNIISIHPISYSGEDYAGLSVAYELTPLIRWDNYLIMNLSDGSMFFSPALSYSAKENLDIRFGLQFFAGSSGDEYGDKKNSSYLDFSWYF